jgi:hypothetical protein
MSRRSMVDVSIRHAELDEADSSAAKAETAEALAQWWARWEDLPATKRDRPVAEVLTEQRSDD